MENHLSQALMLSELVENLHNVPSTGWDCWDPWPSNSGPGAGINDLGAPSSPGDSTILKFISTEFSKSFKNSRKTPQIHLLTS